MSGTGQKLYKKAKTLIPGGTQLLTKRPEMFLPEKWPSYYSKAQGAEVWDLDGNKYIDMSYNGIGACILGHADPDVNAAVHAAVDAGSMSTLNCPEEVELAEMLCDLHPWAGMVRYTRSGGEAMAVAVRIARAGTGREKVAFSGYHGWHDWYLSANLADDSALDGHLLAGLDPAGVPRGLRGSALPFHYNHLSELEAIVEANPGQIAAIIMEPLRFNDPAPDFLEGARRIADEIGAALIYDEITMGFRMNTGGVHLLYGMNPDIAVLGKAMSNGYPMAAIIGRESVMQAAQTTFISSTYWTERIGPTAALATIRKHRDENVPRHLNAIGSRVQQGWNDAAASAELRVHVSGVPPLSHLEFEYPNKQAIRTLFTQKMLKRGFLATNSFYATYAHQECHVGAYLEA
ncbi:MAG: aminotransferase class III-fold pyridoxal phosphate-dependent enzyme, partial [Ardenticatenaceae bacterium]